MRQLFVGGNGSARQIHLAGFDLKFSVISRHVADRKLACTGFDVRAAIAVTAAQRIDAKPVAGGDLKSHTRSDVVVVVRRGANFADYRLAIEPRQSISKPFFAEIDFQLDNLFVGQQLAKDIHLGNLESPRLPSSSADTDA